MLLPPKLYIKSLDHLSIETTMPMQISHFKKPRMGFNGCL